MKVSVKFFRSPAYIKRKKQKQNEPLSCEAIGWKRRWRGWRRRKGGFEDEWRRRQGASKKKRSSIKEDPFRSRRRVGRTMVGKVVEERRKNKKTKREEEEQGENEEGAKRPG